MKALQEGAYIKHFQYGLGVVTESDSDRTSIDFDLHGVKKFVTSIMVVEAAEGTPPKRKRAKRVKKVAQQRLRRRQPPHPVLKSCRRIQVSQEIIVQFVGFEVKPLVREYTFTVREPSVTPREFTISIANEAFNEHRVRYSGCPGCLFAEAAPRTGDQFQPPRGHSLRNF